jgi:hypothetical protein
LRRLAAIAAALALALVPATASAKGGGGGGGGHASAGGHADSSGGHVSESPAARAAAARVSAVDRAAAETTAGRIARQRAYTGGHFPYWLFVFSHGRRYHCQVVSAVTEAQCSEAERHKSHLLAILISLGVVLGCLGGLVLSLRIRP